MIDFSTLKGLTIPEGNVTEIKDANGNVLWSAVKPHPVVVALSRGNAGAGITSTLDGEDFSGIATILSTQNLAIQFTSGSLYLNDEVVYSGGTDITYIVPISDTTTHIMINCMGTRSYNGTEFVTSYTVRISTFNITESKSATIVVNSNTSNTNSTANIKHNDITYPVGTETIFTAQIGDVVTCVSGGMSGGVSLNGVSMGGSGMSGGMGPIGTFYWIVMNDAIVSLSYQQPMYSAPSSSIGITESKIPEGQAIVSISGNNTNAITINGETQKVGDLIIPIGTIITCTVDTNEDDVNSSDPDASYGRYTEYGNVTLNGNYVAYATRDNYTSVVYNHTVTNSISIHSSSFRTQSKVDIIEV